MEASDMYTNPGEDRTYFRTVVEWFSIPLFSPPTPIGVLVGLVYGHLLTRIMTELFPVFGFLLMVVMPVVYFLSFLYGCDYLKQNKLPGPYPAFPWGTEFGLPFWRGILRFNTWLYKDQGGKKYCAYLNILKPTLYVGNPDLIKCITIRDFSHFTDRNPLLLTDELERAVFALHGEEWRSTRSAMTPAFSASKLRMMHSLCTANASKLRSFMLEEMTRGEEVELKDAFGRFTMDNAASCAFGVNCNSFTDPTSEFAAKAAKLFATPKGLNALRMLLLMVLLDTGTEAWLRKYILWDPYAPLVKFFGKVVCEARRCRQSSHEEHNDFLQLLLDTKDAEGNRALSDASITAQCVLFFIVGYDTTAALLTFCAYSLAMEPEWQSRVHDEIDVVLGRHEGDLTYDAIADMPALDRVISETLRLYPPAISMERTCTEDYAFPGTDLKILKGMKVQIPIFQLHRDPEHYPKPEKFDPDRFLPQAKQSRHPCVYIPFGSGPRNCMAVRFALYETKVALVTLLKENKFVPGASTPAAPMPLDEKAFFLTPKQGCGFIKVVPRH